MKIIKYFDDEMKNFTIKKFFRRFSTDSLIFQSFTPPPQKPRDKIKICLQSVAIATFKTLLFNHDNLFIYNFVKSTF